MNIFLSLSGKKQKLQGRKSRLSTPICQDLCASHLLPYANPCPLSYISFTSEAYFWAMIQHLILDLGGVLLKINYEAVGNNFRALGMDGLKEVFFAPGPNNILYRFEKGQIDGPAFAREMLSMAPKGVSEHQIRHAWDSILDGIWPDTLPLLQQLRKRYRLYLWSNINDWHYQTYRSMMQQLHPELDFESLFQKAYYSHLIGHRKPDPEGYRLILDEQKLDANTTVFVDDLPENAKGASAVGIKGLHLDLRKGDTLRALLLREGLLD